MVESEKLKDKGYSLNDFQRELFLKKVVPTLLIGSIIWLTGELVFSFAFQGLQLSGTYLIIYIFVGLGEILLYISVYYLAKSNKKYSALFLYVIFSYFAGILSLPIVIYTDFLTQVHMVVSLTVGANLIIILMGLILKEKYFARGHFWGNLFIFCIGLASVEVIFIFIFDIHNFLLTIPLTLSYICIIALPTMFYGSKVIKKDEKSPWIFMFAKIQGVILLSLIIAIGIVLIVLLIIVIAILAGDSTIDLSGLSISGGAKRRKKRKM